MRRGTAGGSWQTTRFTSIEEADPVIESVAATMVAAGYPEDDIVGVRLAMQEAIVNAVQHGNGNNPAKRVEVHHRVSADGVLIKVQDQGRGFDPNAVPDPCAPENLERLGGRGLCLMRAVTTWLRFDERGNCVTLCKYRTAC
jgi:serine/threonine-protein kinase RsbW